MRTPLIALLVIAAAACGSPSTIVPPLKQAAPANPAVLPIAWTREVVDYISGREQVAIAINTAGEPQIAAGLIYRWTGAVYQLTHTITGWTPSIVVAGYADRVAFDPAGHAWSFKLLDGALLVRAPGASTDETITQLSNMGNASGRTTLAIAFDREGRPHVCTTNHDEHDVHSLIYLTRAATPARWIIETFPLVAEGCAIAVASDGSVDLAYVAGDSASFVSTKRNGRWTTTPLASTGTGTSIAARSTSDGVAIAFHDHDVLRLARRTIGGPWQREVIAKVTGVVHSLVLAVDRIGRAHVAYGWSREFGGNYLDDIMYVAPGAAPTTIGGVTAAEIALALDRDSNPHLAFFDLDTRPMNADLVYARVRRPGDPHGNALVRDTTAMIAGAAADITARLGSTSVLDDARAGRDERLARGLSQHPPTLAEFERRCTAGDSDACLVGATIATPDSAALADVQIEATPCTDGRGGCARTVQRRRPLGVAGWLDSGSEPPRHSDSAAAHRMFARACELGVRVACLQLATLDRTITSPASRFLAACHPDLVIACEAALANLPAPSIDEVVARSTIRKVLVTSCQAPNARGCNALAYLEENGYGGPKSVADAIAHHILACRSGFALSCTRLLGITPRPAVDGEDLSSLMREACDEHHQEPECLALATMYEVGWGVKRDPAAARAVLEMACREHQMPLACKRIRTPLTAPK